MKKIFITIIAMLLPLMASADAVEIDGIYYNLNPDTKQAKVAQNPNKYSGNVLIPDNVAYNNVKYSVTSIGDLAFYECSNLTSVTIPNGVTSIGDFAFCECSALTSIIIPNSVTRIWGFAFKGCSALTSISIPNGVTDIGIQTFMYCSSLTSITIPNSVTSIETNAFLYCSSLTSITIPSSVTSIGNNVFGYCSSLASIVVESGNTKYDSRDNCNAIIYKKTSTLVAGCKNTIIPNSVTNIGYTAFEGCSGLTSITIPNSVTSIANDAFRKCSGLTSITIPSSVTYIDEYAFDGCSDLESISVEKGNTNYDSRNNCNAIIETSSNTLVAGCKNTIIPNSVVSVGAFAFSGRSGMPSIIIPNSVTSIGEWAFSNCSGLTSVTIPNSVTSIGDLAFSGCSGLTSITIPNSVTSIGGSAFGDCNNLESIVVESGNTKYDSRNNCNAIIETSSNTLVAGCKNTIIPNSVTSIDHAFVGCSGLTSIAIPNSVTSIGDFAFTRCSSLTSIAIPNSVTTIGDCAFYGCSGLTSITIPNSVTSIGYEVFENCSSLTSVTIPNSVTSIGDITFEGCDNLQYVWITSDKVPNTSFLGNTSCQYVMSQKTFDSGIPQIITNYATYSDKPMFIQVKSKTATSAVLELNPIDVENGGQKGDNTYYVILQGLSPTTSISGSWKLDPFGSGIVSLPNDKTISLVMEVQAAQALSTTKAKLSATVNEPNDDNHFGFEWRRIGVDDLVPSNVVYSQLYDGQIVGTLNNLNPDISYKYRPFYKSDSGDMFYGDWIGFLTGDANVFFEPEVHTKEPVALTKDGAQLSGVWVEGTEDIQEKGFEYWPKNSGARPATRGTHVTAVIVKGNETSVTLEGLEAGTEYVYRSYLRTASGTIYGEEMTFKTPLMGDANDDGKVNAADIVEVVNAKAGNPSASFNMTNADTDGNGTLTEADITAIVNIIMKR